MRIVGGTFRGRSIVEPKTSATRPTSDRVREAVFNILTHHSEFPALEGARVIDVFAGTGALGLEALSRQAAFCLFVENGAEARGIVRQNIEAFGLQGVSKLYRRDATKLGEPGTLAPFDIAFLDPPYGRQLGEHALNALAMGWLKPEAGIILEERTGIEIDLPPQFTTVDVRTYGDTQVVFAKSASTNTGHTP